MMGHASDCRLPGIALIGYRGSGKSTIGPLLGQRLGLRYIDADTQFEQVFRQSIANFFRTYGERNFRELEAFLLSKVVNEGPCVLSTGGGAVVRDSNRVELKRLGYVVWLKAPAEVLARRIKGDLDSRPALTAAGALAEISSVLSEREPLYQSTAHLAVETSGLPVEATVDIIVNEFQSWSCRPDVLEKFDRPAL